MWDVLKGLPTCLRVCAGTDGSVTLLLELLTEKKVEVKTIKQHIIKSSHDTAKLLEIKSGEEVNSRIVTLGANGIVYVLAKSFAPIKRMPHAVKEDLMRADIPIGMILREHRLETRRDILSMEIIRHDFFGDTPVLSREYIIIHNKNILMWINECFPVDERWRM